MQAQRQKSCEERIAAHLAGRVEDFAGLAALAGAYDADSLEEALNTGTAAREAFDELVDGSMFEPELIAFRDTLQADEPADVPDRAVEELRESAETRMGEYPLGVSRRTVFRVELSTGGPADWLEVLCDGDTPNYEPAGDGEHYEVARIVYHFADWFDHAERELHDDELAAAEAFVSRIIPELID